MNKSFKLGEPVWAFHKQKNAFHPGVIVGYPSIVTSLNEYPTSQEFDVCLVKFLPTDRDIRWVYNKDIERLSSRRSIPEDLRHYVNIVQEKYLREEAAAQQAREEDSKTQQQIHLVQELLNKRLERLCQIFVKYAIDVGQDELMVPILNATPNDHLKLLEWMNGLLARVLKLEGCIFKMFESWQKEVFARMYPPAPIYKSQSKENDLSSLGRFSSIVEQLLEFENTADKIWSNSTQDRVGVIKPAIKQKLPLWNFWWRIKRCQVDRESSLRLAAATADEQSFRPETVSMLLEPVAFALEFEMIQKTSEVKMSIPADITPEEAQNFIKLYESLRCEHKFIEAHNVILVYFASMVELIKSYVRTEKADEAAPEIVQRITHVCNDAQTLDWMIHFPYICGSLLATFIDNK